MTDPVQMLIDAGAIPSAPFIAQSRAVYQRRSDEARIVYVLRRFIPAPNALAVAVRHAVSAQERPDLLSARVFGDPLLYWRIADANAVVDPNELTDTVGRRIVISQAPGT
jgi:hypothetical protein